MSAFGGQSSMQTGSQKGQSDNALKTNYHGSAPLDHTITSDTWLPGTTGVDCKLVHGDRWQEITGKMTQNTGGDKASRYGGAFTETYNGEVTRTMNKGVEETYQGGVSRDYLGHVEETFWVGHNQTNKVEEIEIRQMKLELVNTFSWECGPCAIDIVGLDLSVAGTSIDVSPVLQLEMAPIGIGVRSLVDLGTAGFKLEYVGGKNEGNALDSKIHAIKTALSALQTKVGALEATSAAKVGPNQIL